jgi:hypothetical protein
MATHYIAAVHLIGGSEHKHVSSMVWINGSTFKSGLNTTAQMVAFIEDKGGDVKVSDGTTAVSVGVVHPSAGVPYLRTHEDGKWTDNLLALPQF